MKWSFANVGLIMLGLFGLFIIFIFHEITVSNEQDYYTLKDATEAAMIDAVDVAYYRLTGHIKISEQKFVENFTRRFTQTSTFGQGNYKIEFYDIQESPPKVSLRIVDATSNSTIMNMETSTDITNTISAILDGYKPSTVYNSSNAPTTFTCDGNSQDPTMICAVVATGEYQTRLDESAGTCYYSIDGGSTWLGPYGLTPTCDYNYSYNATTEKCDCTES